MSTDLYRVVYARAQAVKDVPRESAVRLYCTQNGSAWCLQVRAVQGLGLGGYREGKAFFVSSASLDVEDLRALRDACDALLNECAAPTPSADQKKEGR